MPHHHVRLLVDDMGQPTATNVARLWSRVLQTFGPVEAVERKHKQAWPGAELYSKLVGQDVQLLPQTLGFACNKTAICFMHQSSAAWVLR